ncbi:elongation factor P [Deinococcus cellulosilyticus]|uniref:Elongation factor P n=1 Tax=Deinococcus cellulosilyticus (strain DSM 18568 / NBRC 106333 / KACC 11606 / 5516J-15) TaxID=1223518 RepID=A0A511MXC1_DEIC1|nr:elongation factor P [Deinococcus cellulosilyticus]GEM45210.1 elongation factor P [Deinococcus cellulosilyticus NBRC 106333 = KACC 11606]
MISVTELRNGTKVEMDGQLWECLDYSHLKMGRGGAKVVTKFRNMETGSIVDRTFNSGEKLQDIFVESRSMQFLYQDGDDYLFMDMETFDQVSLPVVLAGDQSKFLVENMQVDVQMYKEKPLKIELPNQVVLEVVETDPGVRGDTVSGGTKPAKLSSGATIQVPLFVETGNKLKVDTRDGGKYLGRA